MSEPETAHQQPRSQSPGPDKPWDGLLCCEGALGGLNAQLGVLKLLTNHQRGFSLGFERLGESGRMRVSIIEFQRDVLEGKLQPGNLRAQSRDQSGLGGLLVSEVLYEGKRFFFPVTRNCLFELIEGAAGERDMVFDGGDGLSDGIGRLSELAGGSCRGGDPGGDGGSVFLGVRESVDEGSGVGACIVQRSGCGLQVLAGFGCAGASEQPAGGGTDEESDENR